MYVCVKENAYVCNYTASNSCVCVCVCMWVLLLFFSEISESTCVFGREEVDNIKIKTKEKYDGAAKQKIQ